MARPIDYKKFEELEAKRANAEASGDPRELGKVLIELSYHSRDFGVPDGFAFDAARTYALQAVKVLRTTEDRKLLASALRATDLFCGDHLEEALLMSREIGDHHGVVRTLHRMATHVDRRLGRKLNRQAEQIAREHQDYAGLGMVLQQRSVQFCIAGRDEQTKLLIESAAFFLQAEDHSRAGIAYKMASFMCDSGSDSRELLERAETQFRVGKDYSRLSATLRCLARVAHEDGNRSLADAYEAKRDELDTVLHGSRKARLEYDKQLLEDVIADTLSLSDQSAQVTTALEKSRAELFAIQQELDRLADEEG